MIVSRALALLLASLLAATWPRATCACPVCVVGPGLTPAQRVQNANSVALVRAEGGAFRTVAAIKGQAPLRVADVLPRGIDDVAGRPPSAALVVIEEPMASPAGPGWSVLGSLDARHADWLRALNAMPATSETTPDQWRARVGFHGAYLEHTEPLLAETAYGEIARAPYAAIRSLRGRVDPTRVLNWLDDPARAPRAALYTLLLGVAGGSAAEARIARDLALATERADAGNLAALLVADLELHGVDRLPWLERTYLATGRRSMAEVQAALLALSVHGGADARVRRDDVVAAYRRFARTRHQFAGFPADDLRQWRRWDAVPDYAGLLASRALQNPASTYLILRYLDAAPQPEAQRAAAEFRERRGAAPQR